MDKYRIDSHKLIYHVSRVNDWHNGKRIYPIYMEISPSGTCNHRCTFCALDYMKYQKRYIDADLLKIRLSEMGRLGLRSIMYAGEGEPLMHPQIDDIIINTTKSGIDAAISTNGVLLKEALSERILEHLKWIKVSINGAKNKTYMKIHRGKSSDLDKVFKNMSFAAILKRNNGYDCTLGMQLLLLPENWDEVLLLAQMAKDIGMDYLVVKPYSQHPLSKTKTYKKIKYRDYQTLSDGLSKLDDANFKVIFRVGTIKRWNEDAKSYDRCLALPFWSYIDAGGNVWGCSAYLGDDRFFYGNINESGFREIWNGSKRLRSLAWVEEKVDAKECRMNCRMENINAYLWDLMHPGGHVNFI